MIKTNLPFQHPDQFNLWAAGDAHVGTDLKHGRESLIDAIYQSEFGGEDGRPPVDWDIMVDIGDLSGSQGPPVDEEGMEVIRQYSVLKKHKREQVYNILGNHDGSGEHEETQWGFQKWVDPLGENTEFSGVDASKRPFQVEGTWYHYKFEVGNILFLLMGDRNDGGPPVGRGVKGGYPAGAVTQETFDWWVEQVESNQDKIIVSIHHHMLKETTVAAGPWEGFVKNVNGNWKGRYHGYFPDGGPEGASYLYFVGGKPDAQAFENYLIENPGAIDFWFGGHTHTNPDDTYGGRGHVEQKWGVTFVNCAALSRFHGSLNVPMSRHVRFTEGSDETAVRCYMHTSEFKPQGWYESAERLVKLRRPFVKRGQ